VLLLLLLHKGVHRRDDCHQNNHKGWQRKRARLHSRVSFVGVGWLVD
jgi:hypothetical protein